MKTNRFCSLDDYAGIDSIIDDASDAIDDLQFEQAIDRLKCALGQTKDIFGETVELGMLKDDLEEMENIIKE